MGKQANVELVRRLYVAFSAGDGEAMSQIFAPDIVWNTPGTSQISGHYEGQDAVLKLFGLCGELAEGTLSVEPETVEAVDDNTVVATHHLTAHRADGARLDTHETETVTVENGRISRVDESVEDQAASDAFWR